MHRDLSMCINNRYCVKNPDLIELEVILKKHVKDYNERFGFYYIICEWQLDFVYAIICVKSDRKNTIHRSWDLRKKMIEKNDNFGR